MPSFTYTYTLTNGQTADADEVTQNFNDVRNGVTDGTKDISVAALTAAGTTTLNGAVTLGNAAADDITVTGSLASSIPIKTTNTYNIGSSTLGLASVYFGTADTDTARVVSAALAASRTYTMPDAGANASFVMTAGAQTIAGDKTLSGTTTLSGGVSGDTTFSGANTFSGSRNTFNGLVSLGNAAELTISSGSITATRSYHRVDTESDTSTDNLTTINGGQDGDILVLSCASNARDVVVVNDTGNIRLDSGSSFTLDNVHDKLMLIFDAIVDEWTEISRTDVS